MGAADARPDLVDRRESRLGPTAALDERLERLSDSHPASPRYGMDARGADQAAKFERADDAQDRVRPLTDAEHADHIAEVEARLDAAREAGLATDVQHTIDPDREIWSRDRRALHDAVIEDLYAAGSEVPCEHKAILAGGLPGSGKTTVLNEYAGIELSKFMMINPDIIKEELSRRDLVPLVDGLSPMEASDLVHEESSHIAKRLSQRAQLDGRNVIWDVTMSSPSSTERRVDALRAAGYTRIDGIFVDIPVEVSVRRADSRHRVDHDEYRMGEGLGGRYIPRETIMEHVDADWGSQNRKNFEKVKHCFDGWSRYDNSVDGRPPVLAEARLPDHHDERERG